MGADLIVIGRPALEHPGSGALTPMRRSTACTFAGALPNRVPIDDRQMELAGDAGAALPLGSHPDCVDHG